MPSPSQWASDAEQLMNVDFSADLSSENAAVCPPRNSFNSVLILLAKGF